MVITSGAEPLLPNLETLEISAKVAALKDVSLLEFIINRMDPSPLSSYKLLKHVKVAFYRKSKMSIEEVVLKHAREAGIPSNIKLELDYSLPSKSPQLAIAETILMTRKNFQFTAWSSDRADEEGTSITSGVPLLPHLETLEILPMVKINALSDAKLLQFITSRMDPSPSTPTALLREVNVTFHNEMTQNIHQCIRQYAKDKDIAINTKVKLTYHITINMPISFLPMRASNGQKRETDIWCKDHTDEYTLKALEEYDIHTVPNQCVFKITEPKTSLYE
ncbi:hypothetical protein JR316_0001673 [Psilocybe cubensis]|uniref:Uncharacterized protein n=1 Tax=Psilocybe cubensis TaxID=181762 RepID=A0ACB8HA74_PSICU|nr:hypothetical protein JR316_0001673 [Psilocybe cubensis]KAH9484771.1 hypothetical protein JR316_0001673 [Psilocybe cubensis]